MAEDESEQFSWSNDAAVVIKTTAGIAVYTNPHGDIVIRQDRVDGQQWDTDPFVVIPRDRVTAVIAALQKEIED
jgi:hypothetical protein